MDAVARSDHNVVGTVLGALGIAADEPVVGLEAQRKAQVGATLPVGPFQIVHGGDAGDDDLPAVDFGHHRMCHLDDMLEHHQFVGGQRGEEQRRRGFGGDEAVGVGRG